MAEQSSARYKGKEAPQAANMRLASLRAEAEAVHHALTG
jgi:hypothetical protein